MLPPYYNSGPLARAAHALASPFKSLYWRAMEAGVRRQFKLAPFKVDAGRRLCEDLMLDAIVSAQWCPADMNVGVLSADCDLNS